MPVATIAPNVTAAIAAHATLTSGVHGISSYGATLIDDADAATARTTLGLGTAATLAVGTSAGNVVQLDGSARLPAVDGSQLTGIATSPGGSDTQLQYNNAGVLAGASGITRTASGELTLSTRLVAPVWRPPADSTSALQLQTAGGTAFFIGDTTNQRVGISPGGFPTLGPGGALDAILTVKAPTLTRNGNTIAYLAAFNRVNSDVASWFLGTENSSSPFNAVLVANNGNLKLGSDYIGTFTAHIFMGGLTGDTYYGRIGVGTVVPASKLDVADTNSSTSAVQNAVTMRITSSGTPGAGFGVGFRAGLKSSTTTDQDAGRLTYEWVTATHASRASRGKLTAYYTSTEQEAIRWDGDTGGVKLGFYGVTAVARQTLATGAGASVDDVITALQNLGLLKQS